MLPIEVRERDSSIPISGLHVVGAVGPAASGARVIRRVYGAERAVMTLRTGIIRIHHRRARTRTTRLEQTNT